MAALKSNFKCFWLIFAIACSICLFLYLVFFFFWGICLLTYMLLLVKMVSKMLLAFLSDVDCQNSLP